MKTLNRFKKLLNVKLRSFGRTNKAIFDDIYNNSRWGSNANNESSSGKGSFPENTREYEEFVIRYIKDHAIESILDIGCGDFQVSKRILKASNKEISYFGTDVSQMIIDRNKEAYETDMVQFRQLDATCDNLPRTELIIVREVLQHLPNKDVEKVLSRFLAHHKDSHILITNTIALTPHAINIDIPAGSASRAGLGSGLWIDRPPFNYEIEEVLRIPHCSHDTVIVTCRLLGRKCDAV